MARSARTRLSAAALLVAATAGCSGARADKTGGPSPIKPRVLTLASWDGDYAVANFASEVERLSNGSLRIRLDTNWTSRSDPTGTNHERALVADVRAGRVPLGIVGVRVWDTLGVQSFRALVAPFLIQSLEVEGRALQDEHAARALASVSRRGVVGIALLPGFLRRPFGITRRLAGPSDYRRANIGVVRSGVAASTFRSLGARPQTYVPGDISSLDGAELDLVTIVRNVYDQRPRALTRNVVLWPKPQTIVMNRASFDRLPAVQRRVLLHAGRTALQRELRRDAQDEHRALSLLCADGSTAFVTATAADRAALRAAVAPVYQAVERDAATRAWIATIRRLDETMPETESVSCP